MSAHEETRPPHQRQLPTHIIEETHAWADKNYSSHCSAVKYSLHAVFDLLAVHRITTGEAQDTLSAIFASTLDASIMITIAATLKDYNTAKTTDAFTANLAFSLMSALEEKEGKDRARLLLDHIHSLHEVLRAERKASQ